MQKADFLVIGGGIAGLTFALEAAKTGTVHVLFKKEFTHSSTDWAQGGIAGVHAPDDSYDLHVRDTEVAGAGLCAGSIVNIVVSEGPRRIDELISRGARFDRSADNSYHLHQEGGHSRRRIYHAADATGHEIQRALLAAAKEHPAITLFEQHSAIDLITSHKIGFEPHEPNAAIGAYVLRPTGQVEAFLAKKILLATGGAGKVYLYTSNPDIATGDGIAMAYRAGVPVANMEFVQFHPTCLYHPEAKTFLITEAMRGEGAVLKGLDGEPFMKSYHERGDLAPRDIVARAIDHEMKAKGYEHVWLDIRHRDPEFVKAHFPTIYERCLKYGIDITAQMIPVVPAAHYLCGGIVVDEQSRTVLRNLYAAGECAHTGLHGANRLASNSLLEGLVFSFRAAADAVATMQRDAAEPVVPEWNPGSARNSDEEVIITQNWDEVRRVMWNYVGIVRSDKRLRRALRRIELIEDEIQEYYWNFYVTPDLIELRNLCLVAKLVIQCALSRKESRGLHYTIDYPALDNRFLRDTVLAPPFGTLVVRHSS